MEFMSQVTDYISFISEKDYSKVLAGLDDGQILMSLNSLSEVSLLYWLITLHNDLPISSKSSMLNCCLELIL